MARCCWWWSPRWRSATCGAAPAAPARAAFTNLELLERVAPHRPGWYRHLPAARCSCALVLLTVALAGPTAEQKVPRNRATVVLVIDVSLSMQATDVEPTRLAAAQAAAKPFADELTPGVNLGLVSFAGIAAVLVSPTTDRDPVKRAVDGLKLAESTATGEAIFAALQSIETFGAVVPDVQGPPPAPDRAAHRRQTDRAGPRTATTRAGGSPRRARRPRPRSRSRRSPSAPTTVTWRSTASASRCPPTTTRCDGSRELVRRSVLHRGQRGQLAMS